MAVPSTFWLGLGYFTYFFSFGIFLPFWSVWLKGENIEASMIGILLGVGLVARFIGSLIISSMVKDPSKLINSLRFLSLLSLLFAIGFVFGSHWAWLVFVMIGFNLFFFPIGAFIGCSGRSVAKTIHFRLWQGKGLGFDCIYCEFLADRHINV